VKLAQVYGQRSLLIGGDQQLLLDRQLFYGFAADRVPLAGGLVAAIHRRRRQRSP